MKIIGLDEKHECAKPFPCLISARDGENDACIEDVMAEFSIDVYINGALTLRIVCTANYIAELILGRLYTEGMICGIDDVGEMVFSNGGSRADVKINRAARECEFAEELGTSCTGNRVLNGMFADGAEPKPLVPIEWEREWIYSMADYLDSGAPLYKRTRGAHSCFLSVDGAVIYMCEDLGRHNALDKVIGRALIAGVDLHQAALYTSGRVPTDMVMKAVRAGVPVLASKAVPTDRAIELAEKYDLTLICAARGDGMKIYNDPAPSYKKF